LALTLEFIKKCCNTTGDENMSIDLYSLLKDDLKLIPSICAGQVIVVTGAGRGIGLQTARAFALLGGKVILAELSEAGREVEKQIQADGGEAFFVQTDVSDSEAVNRLATMTHDHFGEVTVLINNAIYIGEAAVIDMPVDQWDKTIAVNLRGTFLMCKAFLPDMLRQRGGTILNLVSTDAMPGLAAYIASKQGITGFSQSLAQEVGEAGVRVIPFAPGMVDTPGIRSIAEGLAPRLGLQAEQFLNLSLNAAYMGLMPAEHAAAAAVYLALKLADEFHGQVVNGYEILERAGLFHSPTGIPVAAEAPAKAGIEGYSDLLRQLANILVETDQEFNRLPIFVRPMARQGFKIKAGQSLADWTRLLSALESGSSPLPPNLIEMLEKLASYYRDVPKETARFTGDEETLRQVAELSGQRIGVIQKLRNKLIV
jgi:NAD(P)-dependent dehydrogenase (short-subunit alcohol dehydrogenase family)